MEVPDECAICFALEEAKIHLERICQHIQLTCGNKGRKKDFGLEQSFVKGILSQLVNAIKYHHYYHANAEQDALNDFELNLESGQGFNNVTPQVPPNPSATPKRFKPWKRKNA